MPSLQNISFLKGLICATFFFGLSGLIDLFAPLDLLYNGISSSVRATDVSGSIVIAEIDDYAAEKFLVGPHAAEHISDIISRLREANALSITFADEMNALDEIITSLEPNHKVAIPVHFSTSNSSSLLGSFAVSNFKDVRYWGGVEDIEYHYVHDEGVIPAAESVIASISDTSSNRFWIDYSYNVDSLPRVSLLNADDLTLSSVVAGKHVIVGYEAAPLMTGHKIIGVPERYGHPTVMALGAETLLRGPNRHMSWPWSLALACLMSLFILSLKRIVYLVLASVGSLIGLTAIGITLNALGYSGMIAHGYFLIISMSLYGLQLNLKRHNKQSHKDGLTGLPTLDALEAHLPSGSTLIVARLQNFEESLNYLDATCRKKLISTIATFLNNGDPVYLGRNGYFYWLINIADANHIENHLKGLSLVFRNGLLLNHERYNFAVTFGVDRIVQEQMSERIIGANLAVSQTGGSKMWSDFKQDHELEARWKATCMGELAMAIENQELYPAIQPKFDLRTRRVCGAEALARWHHPARGHIGPDEFIPIARNGSLLSELTFLILKKSLEVSQDAIRHIPNFRLAINVTSDIILEENFTDQLEKILSDFGVSPSNLTLEFTETSVLSELHACLPIMNSLRSLGVQLSIDDYGTGNSTLEFVKSIPATELKIDKQFVDSIGKMTDNSELVESTIRLGQMRSMSVVAEGIEDEETLINLIRLGCDIGQGYYLSRPLLATDFQSFINGLIQDVDVA